MDRETKIGILFIVIGICIPLAALPFVRGYDSEKGIFDNLYRVGIPVKDQRQPDQSPDPSFSPKESNDKSVGYSKLIPKRIPFRFFLVFTLIFLYMGIARIARAKERAAHKPTGAAEPEGDSGAIKPE